MQWERIDHCKWRSTDFEGFEIIAWVTKKKSNGRARVYNSKGKPIKNFKANHIIEAMNEATSFVEYLTRKDPLHVPSAELVVWHKGKEALLLNKRLLDQQICWDNLEEIKKLHKERLELEDKMREESDQHKLIAMDEEYTQLEFKLQDAWKFSRDKNFHRFWNRPKCECPKLDNEDAYPHGRYVVTGGCPLHGDF